MKRTLLTMAIAAIAANSVIAQTQDNKKVVDGYKAKIEASDKDINDAKKGAALKTWENRGKLLVEASKANTKGISASMPASKSDANLFNNLELLMGTPSEKKPEGEYELWIYPTVTFYIQSDQVQFWKETYVADADALSKAAEAYRKAAELDPKGAYKDKKTTMDLIRDLRATFFNTGLNDYQLKDYKSAAKNFEGALNLTDFPRDAKDTLLNDGQLAYYAGLCAFQADEKDKSETLFKKAANLNYQVGSCYHYIYQINMDKGNEAVAFKTISEAYKKYPNEEQILYDVINYYLGKKQFNEAETYLNTAIQEHPENIALFNVKASMYVTNYGNIKDQYKADVDKISSLKKEMFRQRNNPSEKARVEGELAKQEKTAAATKEDYMNNHQKAAQCYHEMLKKDANNYDANFMLGILSYDKAEIVQIEKDAIPMSEDKDGSKAAEKDKEIHACWKESCEWFEKAHKAKPTEANPLTNLKMLYYKLGDTANNARVKAELEKL